MAAKRPSGLLSSSGKPWVRWDTPGSPGSLSRCPRHKPCLGRRWRAPGREHRQPRGWEKEGKTHKKTYLLLWLLLLMRSRTLPKPEGTEGGLNRAPLSPFKAVWGVGQTI